MSPGSNKTTEHYRGLDKEVTITDLEAYTDYAFTLRACTSGGCGDSEVIEFLTPEGRPSGQQPPRIEPLSNTSFHLSWNPPDKPNGELCMIISQFFFSFFFIRVVDKSLFLCYFYFEENELLTGSACNRSVI